MIGAAGFTIGILLKFGLTPSIGVVGIVLGYIISHIGSLHPNMVDLVVPWWSVVLGLGFSAGTGIIFGMIRNCGTFHGTM